jgi:molybdopterin-guanine dinucleotide biosynthesis protein A
MGSDKSRLPWRGLTLLEYIASEVEAAAGSVAIVGGEQVPGLRTVPDEFPGFGPLGGIATALADSSADWTLIAACDMPYVTREWLTELLHNAAGQITLPRTGDGRIHPTIAVWHRSAEPPVRKAVLAGIHTVKEAIQSLDCRWQDLPDARVVSNVNTPAEWARAQE